MKEWRVFERLVALLTSEEYGDSYTVDAKDRKRPVDIKEVESFEGMMKDVGAQRGFIICSNGHTKAAKRRAQDHIGIKLITAEQIDDFDINSWDHCGHSDCSRGLVLWDATPGIILDGGPVTVQATGKCDECGKFHVWCWGCGKKEALDAETEWQCDCKGPWFWLTSIEPENEGNEKRNGNYLILVLGNGTYHIIDRRPI